MSYEFDEIDHIFGQFKWYLLSYELQRMMPIIMLNKKSPFNASAAIIAKKCAVNLIDSIFSVGIPGGQSDILKLYGANETFRKIPMKGHRTRA